MHYTTVCVYASVTVHRHVMAHYTTPDYIPRTLSTGDAYTIHYISLSDKECVGELYNFPASQRIRCR